MNCIECAKNINVNEDDQEQLNNLPELPMCKECTKSFNEENYV